MQTEIVKVDQDENHIFVVDLKCAVVSEKITDIWSIDGHQVMIKVQMILPKSTFSYNGYYVKSKGTTKWSNIKRQNHGIKIKDKNKHNSQILNNKYLKKATPTSIEKDCGEYRHSQRADGSSYTRGTRRITHSEIL